MKVGRTVLGEPNGGAHGSARERLGEDASPYLTLR